MTTPQIVDPVERRIKVEVTNPNGASATHLVVLVYDPADPFTVAMWFPNDENHRWIFARDLLVAGLTEPAGLGDVRIWPTGDKVAVRLSSPTGTATLTLPVGIVHRFLAATERRVKYGSEQVDVDAWLAELQDGAS